MTRRAGRWSADATHPLNDLLSDGPNVAWAWQDLVERSLQDLQLTGNTLLRVTRRPSDGAPSEIWTTHIYDIAVKLSAGWIDHYLYHPWGTQQYGGLRAKLAAADAIHVQLPDPGCIYWGMSPLAAAARAVDTDIEAAAAQQAAMERVFSPPGIVSVDADNLTRDEVEVMRDRFIEHYTGRDNAGVPLFLGRGAKFSPLYLSPKEMHFLESRRMTREEITGIYGTPPTVAGILEYSNYSNVGALYRQWYDGTLCPMLSRFARAVNRQFVRPQYGRNVKIEYDKSQIPELVEAMAGATTVAEAYMRLGYTRDIINERLGLGMPADAPYADDTSERDAPAIRRVA
jgi:HK97 family phage portal protein